MEVIAYLWQYIVQSAGLAIAYVFAGLFIYLMLRRLHSRAMTVTLVAMFVAASIAFYVPNGMPHAFEYPFFMRSYGPASGPVLPLKNVWEFVQRFDEFERPDDISRDPRDVPAQIVYAQDGVIEVSLTAKEVIAEMAPGVSFNYWTFDGTVPGPFLRAKVGDTIRLSLTNDATSLHHHNIDLHAVTGPGGGAAATNVAPGESKTITFKALNPGIYIYHCAHPNVANHMAHGMYGLILVEPEGGLPPVDHEFYVVQGEFYSVGSLGRKGLQLFNTQAMLDGDAQYVVFNGRTGALVDTMNAQVGDTVRMYVGNGGVNYISSFHVIGEIFDTVYREGDLVSPPAMSLQSTMIPAGAAAVVEFKVDYPGKYVLVDHALARVDRGAWGLLNVSGNADPGIFDGVITPGGGH